MAPDRDLHRDPVRQDEGKPLILLNIPDREFTLFGKTFLPTDTFFSRCCCFRSSWGSSF